MTQIADSGIQIDMRKQYGVFFLPFLSWIGLVFPLILPPIPLGPLALSLSWNRRLYMSHMRRGITHLGRVQKTYEFPMGWLANVGVNLVDLATLGLSHLFITAELLDAMIKQDGTPEERSEISPLTWVIKWLLIGNVIFVAVYIVCPGLILKKLFARLEKHLYDQFQQVKGTVYSSDSSKTPVSYEGVTTFEELARAGLESQVLLFSENLFQEKEKFALVAFEQTLQSLAPDIAASGTLVRWCNMNQGAPSHYRDITQYLVNKGVGRGWNLFCNGELKVSKTVWLGESGFDMEAMEIAARQVLGIPRVALIPSSRVGFSDLKVTSFSQLQDLSRQVPVILITFSSTIEYQRSTRLGIRNSVLPEIRDAVEANRARVCLVNVDKKLRQDFRAGLEQLLPNFSNTSAMLLRDGSIVNHEKFGFFSGYNNYAATINKWLGVQSDAKKENEGTVKVRYYVADSLQEAQRISVEQPVLVFLSKEVSRDKAVKELIENILPDICIDCEKEGVRLCCYNVQKKESADLPDAGVVLIEAEKIITKVEVKAGDGSAIDYVDAAKQLLEERNGQKTTGI